MVLTNTGSSNPLISATLSALCWRNTDIPQGVAAVPMYMRYNKCVCICGVIWSLAAENLQSDNKAGRAFPRLDSTDPVITSALFSLSVTVYQLTVAQKDSLFYHRRRKGRKYISENTIQKERQKGGAFFYMPYSIERSWKTERFFQGMLTKTCDLYKIKSKLHTDRVADST